MGFDRRTWRYAANGQYCTKGTVLYSVQRRPCRLRARVSERVLPSFPAFFLFVPSIAHISIHPYPRYITHPCQLASIQNRVHLRSVPKHFVKTLNNIVTNTYIPPPPHPPSSSIQSCPYPSCYCIASRSSPCPPATRYTHTPYFINATFSRNPKP